jgi:hypothetical protein
MNNIWFQFQCNGTEAENLVSYKLWGIRKASGFGLQAKRLSGAQRKKLVRERKMKEGTWMVGKPKRKTSSSQDQGTAGSSGGVKRPHSDSSTPSQEKQQPKKPRSTQVQAGTYKEAVVGIKMAFVAPS